jgi:carbon storage regulator
MLILSRKLNESIVIDGRITVKVMRVDGDVIKLGIAAPVDVPVHRQEVYEEICRSNQEAVTQRLGPVPRLSVKTTAQAAQPVKNRWQDRRLKPNTEGHNPNEIKANLA